MSVEKYLELNGKYLREAQQLLKEGNFAQASEKLWGAAAEMVKAVAAKSGITLGTHRSLWDFIYQLHEESPHLGLTDLFSAAETLHVNFYEDHLSPRVVGERSQRVRELIEKLRALIG